MLDYYYYWLRNSYLGWALTAGLISWLLYKIITRLFAKQLVLGYLHYHGVPLEKLITVHNPSKLWYSILKSPSVGLGEGYMFKWYTDDNLEKTCTTLVTSPVFQARPRFRLEAWFYNLQTINLSLRVAKEHYDIGNDLYEAMLGKTMQYSCAWWEGCKEGDLDAAQTKKLDALAKKLNLRKGMRVLDIGCGFGTLMAYLAQNYGAEVVGLNISQGQVKEAHKLNPDLDIRIEDYRHFFADRANQKAFDRVVSVGMFEHVGPKNYAAFFQGVRKVLKDDGIFVLHTIGTYDSIDNKDEWIDKYIFPGGVLPSLTLIGEATEEVFNMENWINIGPYYATTLRNWRKRALEFFEEQKRSGVKSKYDEVFQRMWYFYLTFCIVLFRERKTQLWQIVFTPVYPGYNTKFDNPSELQIETVLPVYGVKPTESDW